MAWTDLTFVECSVLTAARMTQLQGNFAALAAGEAGAPRLHIDGVSSLALLHASSGVLAPVSSVGLLQVSSGLLAPQVSSLGALQVASGAVVPGVSSLGTLHVASGIVAPQVSSLGRVALAVSPSGTPAANTLYKAGAGVGFDLPLDPGAATPSLRGVLTQAQGGIAAGGVEGWHEVGAASEPAFQNSWANYGLGESTVAFRKLPSGVVFIKGSIKNGSTGTTVFTLPAGYRPALRGRVAGVSNTAPNGMIVYSTDGTVIIYFSGTPSFLVLDCSFIAEA